MKEQINLQVSFNRNNRSHMQLMEWIDEQTTNKSSFIRETLLMRMMGMFGVRNIEAREEFIEKEFDQDEILRLIQV